jgi:hypothetical protein
MKLWAALNTELVLHKPLDDPMSLDSVEEFLMPLWEDLSTKIEHALKVIYEATILYKSMLYCVVESMESHLVPKSTKSSLNEAQLQRLNHALNVSWKSIAKLRSYSPRCFSYRWNYSGIMDWNRMPSIL